jgi:hypothetical protein
MHADVDFVYEHKVEATQVLDHGGQTFPAAVVYHSYIIVEHDYKHPTWLGL